MNEVSCRANRVLLDAAVAMRVDVDRLTSGLNVAREDLVDPALRVDWAVHVELLARLERELGSTNALQRLGALTVSAASGDLLRRVARHVVSPKELHRAALRWVAPSLFPHLSFRLDDGGERRIRTTCQIPKEHLGSRAFFHVSSGAVAHATELIGLGAAEISVRIDEGDRRSEFHLLLPEARTFARRVKRRVWAALRPSSFVEELEAQAVALRSGYDALLRSQGDFRRVLDRLPIGVLVHRGGTTIYANPSLTRTLGYEGAEDLVGRSVLSFLHPDDLPVGSARMALPAAGGDDSREYRAVRRDGSIVHCELLPAQEVELDGSPARLVTVRDLSEKRRQEQQIVLADRMAALGVIAASVAHEINNPLAYASASLEVVQRATITAEDPPSVVSQSLATAREGLERVRAIVADLKTLSRHDEERGDPTDIHAVLDSTLRLAARDLALRARVTRNYGTSLYARGSAQRLGQVMLNLLINAAEAIPEGDDPALHEIRITTGIDDIGRMIVEIGDTGGGIPPEVLGRIFEPFVTTKPIGSGTGLGLSICHRIVSKLGGELSVRSFAREDAPDGPREVRTVFRVTLAAADPPSEAPRRAPWGKERRHR